MQARSEPMSRSEHVRVDGTAELSAARTRASEVAAGLLGDERSLDVALVTSELVTNALEHGGSPADVFVDVDDEGRLLVRVESAADALPEPAAGTAPVNELQGRGLHIVASLSDHVLISGTEGRVTVTARFDPR